NLWLRPDATLPSTFVAGAPVTAWLPAGAPTTAVEVPRAAVVHHLGRSFVFVAEPPAADGETRFELRELPAAAPSAAGWFVPLGDPPRFSAGEPIVTGGAAVLLSLFVAGAGEDEGN
ncbi:MAG: hypothetical protein KDC48_22095, partial [Planctomycetes bacterium]|nr:hypothetical protein [Planctomycetota bacterium]